MAPFSLKPETLRLYVERVRPYLIQRAVSGQVVTYGTVAADLGLSLEASGEVLGAVSESELQAGRPMLSAIVVAAESEFPSSGFFGLSGVQDDLRRRDPNERVTRHVSEGRRRFAKLEQARVFFHWWEHRIES